MIHRFCVAPMMDRTDRHERYFLRLLTKEAFLYTEMIHSNAIVYGNKENLLKYSSLEHPLGVQLGGSEPNSLREASICAEDYGYKEINLNIGCPSSRVKAGNFGAVLMKEPKLVANCIKEIKRHISIPVTIKCRIGVDDMEEKDFFSFIDTVKDSGCSTFIIHARKGLLKGLSPKENREIPPLNYNIVYELKQKNPELEIILNGGINNLEDGCKNLKNLDGIMMGRNAYSDPFHLSRVDSTFYEKKDMNLSKQEVFLKFIPYLQKELEDGSKIQLITKHLMGFFRGNSLAKEIRKTLANIQNEENIEKTLFKIANQLTS